jgi:histone acetyltransferase (RNA polymerase elongator complex component)
MTEKEFPYIIPVFIPHRGCPHQCVFCNQHSITGQQVGSVLAERSVRNEVEKGLGRLGNSRRAVQIAFYGGSFTALPLAEQRLLLLAVRPFLEDGRVEGIRLSTRPDAIDMRICQLLRDHGVRVVELGVQSMDDKVLHRAGRGHTRRQVEQAFRMLHRFEFTIGGQLMVGLPGDNSRAMLAGVHALVELNPHFVRIYPTVVVRRSPLAHFFEQGTYRPLSLARAVVLTARAKDVFDRHHIPVIRMGLQHGVSLASEIIAGPHHPAFGELVLSRQYYKKLRTLLAARDSRLPHVLSVSNRDQSLLRGQANSNWRQLRKLGLLDRVEIVFDGSQARNTMLLREEAA